jgi:archaellum component FlaF (FlaF/FlaG flagellin family)
MECKLRHILTALVVSYVYVAHVAMAADDGQTQPRMNQYFSNSTTAVDIIGTTSGSGNVKGVACTLYPDGSGYLSSARVTFTVNGGQLKRSTSTATWHPTTMRAR